MEICKQQSEIKMRHYRRYTDLSVMGVRVGVAKGNGDMQARLKCATYP